VLVLFYHATHKELVAINPLPKFASIKGVVFASWWQSLLIGLMVHQVSKEGGTRR
jgi:predicted secreted protein